MNNVPSRVQLPELQVVGHEEADTMMIFYACHLSAPEKTIVARCDDADVLQEFVHYRVRISGRICMDMGLSSKNNRRIRDIKQLAGALGFEIRDI